MASTRKTFTNADVAEYLTNIATAYEIKNKTRFQIVAYENAADTILNHPDSLFHLWQKDPKLLDDIPNIGPSILKKIDYLFKTGLPYPSLKIIFKNIHPVVFTFTKINGIGPINAHKLAQNLKFSTDPFKALDQLVKYSQNGKIRDIPGFGQKSEESILQNTLSFLGRTSRMPLSEANKLADKVLNYLKAEFPAIHFVTLGSLRRQSETIGDIDIAAASDNSEPIINYFLSYPESIQTIARGSDKASIRLLHDKHIDLMVKPANSFGSLLQHFTGSRQHNILLRRHALKMGYSLSEYGLKNIKTRNLYRFNTEEKLYNFLKLKFIPPEKRIGDSEITDYQVV